MLMFQTRSQSAKQIVYLTVCKTYKYSYNKFVMQSLHNIGLFQLFLALF